MTLIPAVIESYKNTILFWILAFALMLLAGITHLKFHQHTQPTFAATQVEQYIAAEQTYYEGLAKDEMLCNSLAQVQSTDQKDGKLQHVLAAQEDRTGSFFLFEEEKMQFWSNNIIKQPGVILSQDQFPLYRENGNLFRTGKIELPGTDDQRTLVYCIPLQLSNRSLPLAHIHPSIPKEITLSRSAGVPILRDVKGQVLLYVSQSSATTLAARDIRILVVLYGIALLALALLISKITAGFQRKWGSKSALIFFILSVIGIRLLSILINFSSGFSGIPTFDSSLTSPVFAQSMGDIMINIAIILWISIVLINALNPQLKELNLGRWRKGLLTFSGYLLILLGFIGLTWFCKHLILESKIQFNFESVLDLDRISIMAIVGIILLVFTIFLWSVKIVSILNQLGLPSRQKIAIGIVSILLVLPMMIHISPSIPLIQFFIVAFIFVVLLDIFIESKKANFTWVILWLLIISGFSSVLLYKINNDKDVHLRTLIAQELIEQQDLRALESISIFAQGLTHTTISVDSSLSARDRIKTQYARDHGYLSNYYELDFPSAQILKESTRTDKAPRMWQKEDEIDHYIAGIDVDGEVILTSFHKKKMNPYEPLLGSAPIEPFKGIGNLAKYEYAIYDGDGHCRERSSSDYPMKLQASLPLEGETKLHFSKNRSELLYHHGDFSIQIGRNLSGLIKPLSLFSYLFIIVVLTILCLLLVNSFIPYLPAEFNFSVSRGISLRNRIQISVLSLILLSFVIIGIATVYYFQNAERRNRLDSVQRSASAIQLELESKFGQKQNLERQDLMSLALKYQTHIHLYDSLGHLSKTSDNVAQHGNNHDRMEVLSIYNLKALGESLLTPAANRASQFTYVSLYDNNTLMGFAGLPLNPTMSAAGDNVKEFMSTLLNVYVLLLLLAVVFALAVSNSITRPMTVLGQKLKDFKLGKSNEPLEWKSNDELGLLINEYNHMIIKLDQSADLLAQTEREVAWREMAKQVAHEIKNPLTPMKLSIQHLQYAMQKADLTESRQLVKRVAITLIEQIDNLSKIAAEFSSFAKMPKAENESISLNELVASVHDLFKKRDDMDFNLYEPIDEIYVLADKSHLLSVLNNLIKNAIQAIPSSRRGVIDIRLQKKGKRAILQVIDNGKGISKEMQDKVFYPNFTTKTSGTGLGLAISKNIIESFDGKIYFETEENVGTTFTFVLPLVSQSSNRKQEDIDLDVESLLTQDFSHGGSDISR